ncbi:MAG: PIN domain-containing protein [Euryarchaeota archaeon]|nr:PIN domain-containing protein [Euryarchaeota archaeon]
MYLVDTNIWLELLLEQEKEEEVRRFFQSVEARLLSISDFSLYSKTFGKGLSNEGYAKHTPTLRKPKYRLSIGIILTKLKKDDVFIDFISDTIEDSGVMRICLSSIDLKQVIQVQQRFQLDFDDGYQYIAAEKNNYVIVSFDSDFDRTVLGRKTPREVMF